MHLKKVTDLLIDKESIRDVVNNEEKVYGERSSWQQDILPGTFFNSCTIKRS
jgi:hypothetical protein